MRKSHLPVLLAIAACARTHPTNAGLFNPDHVPVRGEAAGYRCAKPGDRNFVGKPATQELGSQMLQEARARTLRWVPHGGIITMDYSPSRLTVRLDEQNRIAAMSCG